MSDNSGNMTVYMYATDSTPAPAAAKCFNDIYDLYRSGFVNDDSTVWVNADAPEVGMWVLNDVSSYVHVHRSVFAGWLRLTRTDVKWGSTIKATTSNPLHVLDIRNVPSVQSPAATVIAAHREHDKRVSVVADGSVQRPDKGGVFTFDPFRVIDLPSYNGESAKTTTNEVDKAHAMLNGVALLGCTSPDGGEFVKNNLELFLTDFGSNHADWLKKHYESIEKYAGSQLERVMDRVRLAAKTGALHTG